MFIKFFKLVSLFLFFSSFMMAQDVFHFQGGSLYKNDSFEMLDFYVVEGQITFKLPPSYQKITTVDISEKYVIPPFADAHTHNLDREWQIGFLPEKYLKEGTFYVQNLTSKVEGVKKLRPFFAQDSTVDVAYSHQGLTSTIGHPFGAYEPFEMGLEYSEWEENEAKIRVSRLDEGNSYIFFDTMEDIDNKLEDFFEERPDLVKIFLIESENYSENFGNDIYGDNGLSIEIAEEIIKRCHERNLKVFAHIETAHDFNEAVRIGVDCFAHMPGYGWDGNPETYEKYYISDEELKIAAEKGVSIIPTLGQALNRFYFADSLAKVELVQDFLARFDSFGGQVLIGADAFNQTLIKEIELFAALEIFSTEKLIQIFSVETPKSIFPNRKIASLEEGYEANFLVLNDNPLSDISAVKNIDFLVKQGIIFEK